MIHVKCDRRPAGIFPSAGYFLGEPCFVGHVIHVKRDRRRAGIFPSAGYVLGEPCFVRHVIHVKCDRRQAGIFPNTRSNVRCTDVYVHNTVYVNNWQSYENTVYIIVRLTIARSLKLLTLYRCRNACAKVLYLFLFMRVRPVLFINDSHSCRLQ